ncbi:MAG TPA: YgjV family protein [Terriglobia bacterium]|nr:YgjV family protein [Terriglobia bacterium]
MERMFVTISAHPAACAAGLLGMFCLAVFPLFRSRQAMLLIYICNNFAFILHYGLLQNWTAAAMNLVLALQTVIALHIAAARYRWVYYALMPVLAAMVAATWAGTPSLLAGMAAMFSTFGRMQRGEFPLRLLMLMAMPFWVAHDILVASMPGLIADLLSIATGLVMLYRRCLRETAGTYTLRRAAGF